MRKREEGKEKGKRSRAGRRFVKPRPGHPPSDAYNVAFAAKNGAKVVEREEREREKRGRG